MKLIEGTKDCLCIGVKGLSSSPPRCKCNCSGCTGVPHGCTVKIKVSAKQKKCDKCRS